MNPRRLTRSRGRQLAGVAGGMAEYLDIDPTVVRILWIIVGIASGGLAIVAYVILALVMPEASYMTAPGAWTGAAAPGAATGPAGGWDTPQTPPAWGTGPATANAAHGGYAAPPAPQRVEGRGFGAAAIVGVVFIVIGAIALADAALPGWAAGAIMGPAVILALGAALLVSSLRRRPAEAVQPGAPASPASPSSTSWSSTAATPAYATPSVPGMSQAPSAPWDVTDTQAVDPASVGTAGEGPRPA